MIDFEELNNKRNEKYWNSPFKVKREIEILEYFKGNEEALSIINTDIQNTVHEYNKEDGTRTYAVSVNMGLIYHYRTDEEKKENKKKVMRELSSAFISAMNKGIVKFGSLGAGFYSLELDTVDENWNEALVQSEIVGRLQQRELIGITVACIEPNSNYVNYLNGLINCEHKIFFDFPYMETIEPVITENNVKLRKQKDGAIVFEYECKFKSNGEEVKTKLRKRSVIDFVGILSGIDYDKQYSIETKNSIMWMNRVLNQASKNGYIEHETKGKIEFNGGKKSIKKRY